MKVYFIINLIKLKLIVSGRGLLGRWGPNHAGDPVVTRWAKNQNNDKKKVLEIVLVTRRDSGELALPGGMVDAGYVVYLFIFL